MNSNKKSNNTIMTEEYVELKKKGLEYIRSIKTRVEKLSEIDAELNAIQAIDNTDPIKKAQAEDWIKTLRKEKRMILQDMFSRETKALGKASNLFDENKQLKQELKEARKAKKEALEKINRLKTAQLIKYKKERNESIKKLQEQKKQLHNKLKQQKIKEKEEKIQQHKQQSVSHIQKWYKRQQQNRKRYSFKILIFKCDSCDQYSDEELKNKVEELRRKKRKYFFKYSYQYEGDKYKIVKVLYWLFFQPKYISIKLTDEDFFKYYKKFTFQKDILKEKYTQLMIDKQGTLSKPQQRQFNNTREEFDKIISVCRRDENFKESYNHYGSYFHAVYLYDMNKEDEKFSEPFKVIDQDNYQS